MELISIAIIIISMLIGAMFSYILSDKQEEISEGLLLSLILLSRDEEKESQKNLMEDLIVSLCKEKESKEKLQKEKDKLSKEGFEFMDEFTKEISENIKFIMNYINELENECDKEKFVKYLLRDEYFIYNYTELVNYLTDEHEQAIIINMKLNAVREYNKSCYEDQNEDYKHYLELENMNNKDEENVKQKLQDINKKEKE
jgi:hypothetical protein